MKLTLAFLLCLLASDAAQAQEQPAPVARRIGDPVRLDEYGKLLFEEEKARLDNLAFRLNDVPDEVVYLYVYAGRRACIGEAQAAGIRAKNYLVRRRGIEPARVILRDAGHRNEFTVEVWVQWRGAPEPYASPTVDEDEVKFRNCKPKSRGR